MGAPKLCAWVPTCKSQAVRCRKIVWTGTQYQAIKPNLSMELIMSEDNRAKMITCHFCPCYIIVNGVYLGFGVSVGQNKQSE